MRIYVAGPMRGIPNFNFPLFDKVTKYLREYDHSVFNPAERDTNKYGKGISDSPTGDLKDIADLGFTLRDALQADTDWICRHAEAVAMLPDWEQSKGATAERALAQALGIDVFYVVPDDLDNFALFKSYTRAASLLK